MAITNRLRTIRETAGELGLSPNTVRLWISQGRVPYVRLGKTIRVSQTEMSTPGENCSFVAPENCTPSDAGDEPQTVVSSFRARRFDVVGALVLCGLIARSRSVCSRIR